MKARLTSDRSRRYCCPGAGSSGGLVAALDVISLSKVISHILVIEIWTDSSWAGLQHVGCGVDRVRVPIRAQACSVGRAQSALAAVIEVAGLPINVYSRQSRLVCNLLALAGSRIERRLRTGEGETYAPYPIAAPEEAGNDSLACRSNTRTGIVVSSTAPFVATLNFPERPKHVFEDSSSQTAHA